MGFLGGSVEKNLPANAGDVGSIPGSGRSPGRGTGYPLQYSLPLSHLESQYFSHREVKNNSNNKTEHIKFIRHGARCFAYFFS